MNDGVLAEPQGVIEPLGARRREKAMHELAVAHIAGEIDKLARRVYTHCEQELDYLKKRDEYHFHHVMVRTTCGRFFRKELDQPGISSAHKVEGAPLDDTFVTILCDGRVLLSNQPTFDREIVENPMRPLKFVEGYREGEQLAALNAVLTYLGEHV